MAGSSYAEQVVARLATSVEQQRDPGRAATMAAYMRGRFPFAGIAAPGQKEALRAAQADLPLPAAGDLLAAAEALWRRPEREYRYFATALLARHARMLGPGDLGEVRALVGQKSWWDTVDALAAHVVGPVVATHRELAAEMDRWVVAEDTWVGRTAILHQLRYRERTDAARLFAYCLQRAGEREFFLRKAIGWALREYSKTDERAVRRFVAEHESELSPLSRREALLWLNGGRGASRARQGSRELGLPKTRN